jgi:hypothetical protein
MTKKQQGKVNSMLLASCSLFGMFFMAELCHIQKDGHCYENLKSSFLVYPAWKKDPREATRPAHNFFLFSHQQSTEFQWEWYSCELATFSHLQ